MTWVQYLVAIYLALSFVVAIAADGTKRDPNPDPVIHSGYMVARLFFWLFVLYAGGFWK